MAQHLPTGAAERKAIPLWSGLFKYFPDALVEVARLSHAGNQQHNPGQPLHWAREKSTDHEDTLLRHLLDSGTLDSDGIRHSAKVAWRALAKLQLELEADSKDKLVQSKDGFVNGLGRAIQFEGIYGGQSAPTFRKFSQLNLFTDEEIRSCASERPGAD